MDSQFWQTIKVNKEIPRAHAIWARPRALLCSPAGQAHWRDPQRTSTHCPLLQKPRKGQIVSPWNGQDIYWGQRDRSLLYTSVSASMYYPIPTLSIRLTPLCPAAVSLMWPQLRSSHVLVPSTCAEQDRREGKGCAHRRHTAKIGLTTPFPAWTSREQRAADGGLLISHSMALEDARRRACLSASC